MLAATHSLTHRAPSATRTRARWQPYNSSLPLPSRSPSVVYLNTPPSSSSVSPIPSCHHIDRPRQTHAIQTAKEGQVRDASKCKHALELVDQAVKVLCEIWRPQNVPPAFPKLLVPCDSASDLLSPRINRNSQLLSPVSPNTRPIPIPHPSPRPNRNIPIPESVDSTNNCVPIRGFVHEVLRRSRTTSYILQTALCYLEAIRPKIPELQEKEKSREPQSDDTVPNDPSSPIYGEQDSSSGCASSPMSSPLLCPRRAFLASLVLASKFMQDKCYSNRAWAKLAGLPAREIGRCEHALGEALEWRLWVGKAPVAPATSAPSPAARPVVRSRSEGLLLATPSSFTVATGLASSSSCLESSGTARRALQRSATLPTLAGHDASKEWNISEYEPVPMPDVRLTFADSHDISALFKASSSEDKTVCSPVPDTPGLSSSPTLTDLTSPGGDQTIRMTEFLDEEMAAFSSSDSSFSTQAWLDSVGQFPHAGDEKANNVACAPAILSDATRMPYVSGMDWQSASYTELHLFGV